MPLFHIHGIVGTLLSSSFVGAQIHVTGFDGLTMQRTIAESGATWMSAVPTMYQTMLLRPPREQATRLRAARSSSAPLHGDLWALVEDRLGCPVVNSYGMTEASHQMSSTRIDSGPHAIGTVGWAAGPEIAVLGADGTIRAVGSGEIVVRGAGLTTGYASPAGANDHAFVGGWFRTGDTGSIDSELRIRLQGRIKELINVGGEKVSPFEVEDVLLAHRSVSEAVSFAMPSPLTGEEVHAVVTLSGDADENELRTFARTRLAKFKTPTRIHVVTEIPKGATGKVQRTFLASQLGLAVTEAAPSPDPMDGAQATQR
jgi:acyl-CoA synthetase (AMP-forming)/AMP-acid ligase II